VNGLKPAVPLHFTPHNVWDLGPDKGDLGFIIILIIWCFEEAAWEQRLPLAKL
jgi:hypothetical protein